MPHYQIQIAIGLIAFLTVTCAFLIAMLVLTRGYVRYLDGALKEKHISLERAWDKLSELKARLDAADDKADFWKHNQRNRCRRNN